MYIIFTEAITCGDTSLDNKLIELVVVLDELHSKYTALQQQYENMLPDNTLEPWIGLEDDNVTRRRPITASTHVSGNVTSFGDLVNPAGMDIIGPFI